MSDLVAIIKVTMVECVVECVVVCVVECVVHHQGYNQTDYQTHEVILPLEVRVQFIHCDVTSTKHDNFDSRMSLRFIKQMQILSAGHMNWRRGAYPARGP